MVIFIHEINVVGCENWGKISPKKEEVVMTDSATREELERWVPRQVRRLNGSLYMMAVTCGSWSECYRLVSKMQHRLELQLVKPWQLVKGRNQVNFLRATGQSSLGRSHPGTLPRRKPVRIRKIVVGKISPKKYDEPIGPKEKHHYQVPASMVCTVCGQHELTAWHDTDSSQDFHHRFVRDVKQLEFERTSKAQGMPVTVSSREDLRHLKAEGKI
jgi:hypothetical protein